MKKTLILIVAIISIVACKNDVKSEDTVVIHDTVEVSEIENTTPTYPEALAAIFEAHGGIDTWTTMNNLCYQMEGRSGTETHTTDLKNRKAKIEHKDWSIGYDGEDVWLLQNKPDSYQGNARFYHNLMFYFYAMPFILADDGIEYSTVAETELDGKMYKGIKIGYKANVGDTPEDEYILFYDTETNKMEWLAYTVTFKTGEKSDDWRFIKYSNWQELNGLILPETLTWYNVENGAPTSKRNDMEFTKVTISTLTLDDTVFAKPEAATVIAKE